MASTNPPVVKRPGKPRNKRFVQPVVPVLPQIITVRKNDGGGAYPTDRVANRVIQEASGEQSRRASTIASFGFSNGVHKDGIQELPGDHAAADELVASSATRSPVSRPVSETLLTSHESQTVPSTLVEPSEPPSPTPPKPNTSKTHPDQPTSPSAITANGFNFASHLSQLRSPRARDHQITFHAPLDSPSPSRATHRSLSVPSISTPPPSISQRREASAAPATDMSGTQEGQPPATTEPELQELEAADSSEQSQPHSPPESHPDPTLEPVELDPTSKTIEIDGLHETGDIFQNGEPPETGEPIGGSDDSQPLQTKNFMNGNHLKGHERGTRNRVMSLSSEQPGLEEHSLPPLSMHLNGLFTTKEWVDWSIEVSSPDPSLHPVGYMAHGVLMARSPTLRKGMRRHLLSNRMDHVIVLSPDRYIQPPAFEAALRYLYTESLLTKPEVEEVVSNTGERSDRLTREYQLDIALSYWMAGLILGLQLVTQQAVKLVHEIIGWDILEFTLQQALVLGERTLNVTAELSNSKGVTPGSSPAGSAFAVSPQRMPRNPFSASSNYFDPSEYQDATPNYHYSAVNAIMSKKMKRIVLEFLSQHIDASTFEIEDQPNTILKSYLPETREYSTSSRYRANPALAAIRFGALPLAEEEIVPASQSAAPRSSEHITSAILLNLAYADLRELCLLLKQHTAAIATADDTLRAQSLGSHTDDMAGSTSDRTGHQLDSNLHSWIQKVVAERENRRRKVLKSRTVSNQERLFKQPLWEVVGFEEYADGTDEGWELGRIWKGFTLPGPMVVGTT